VTTLSARYNTKSQAPHILQVTVDPKFGFSSKSGQTYVDGLTKFRAILEAMKRILSDGRGAAFHIVPSSGIIPPWGEVTIKVKSYNNLVGIYEDWMLCQVGKMTRKLPIRLGVVGIPIKFTGPQLVSKHNKSSNPMAIFDLVNFGSRIINPKFGENDGTRLIRKAVLNNNSSDSLQSYVSKRNSISNNLSCFSTKQNSVSILSSKDLGHPDDVDISKIVFPTKKINVENHSPREVRLEWAVYLKHYENREKIFHLDRRQSTDDDPEISDIINPKNRIQSNEVGILDISPSVMIIPPFKSAVLQCNFRNCSLGSFEALVVADVGYINGVYRDQIKYGPRRIKQNGETPQEKPVVSQDMTTIAIKDLDVIAKLRIKAKCIEPRLSLDFGRAIRIKKALRKTADTIEYSNLNTVQFLVNESDAVCSFTLSVEPEYLFSLNASQLYLIHKEEGQYELKQKQQMMITVKFIGSSEFDDLSRKRRVSFTYLDEKPKTFYASERRTAANSPNAISETNEEQGLLSRGLYGSGLGSGLGSGFGTQRRISSTPQRRASTSKRPSISPGPKLAPIKPTDSPKPRTPIPSTPALKLETGNLVIRYSNGMRQEIPVCLEGVYE
jgi:hypothetical protein